MIIIREKAEKLNESSSLRITAYTDRGIPLALSNYVSLGPGGYEQGKAYIISLINNCKFNANAIVQKLEADSRIFGDWSVDSKRTNNTDRVTLRCVDSNDNVSFIEIRKLDKNVEQALVLLKQAGYKITLSDIEKFKR